VAKLSVFNVRFFDCFFISHEIHFNYAKIIHRKSPPFSDLKALSPYKYVFGAFGRRFWKIFLFFAVFLHFIADI
jgi:hypothetical protein